MLGDAKAVSTANSQWASFWAARPRRSLRLAVVAAVLMLLPGCGGVEDTKLDDYLEELEFSMPTESLKEVQLGDYRVSSATRSQEASQAGSARIWVQISCKLYVTVAPKDASTVTKAYERHRGMFDDTIVQIFRSATVDELSDPRWSTIKSRLSDFARPVLGEDRVHQIVIDDYGWEPI